MKSGFSLLLAALWLVGVSPARMSACQYCEMAADPSLQVTFPATDAAPVPPASPSANATLPSAQLPVGTAKVTDAAAVPAVGVSPTTKRTARRIPTAWLQTQLPPKVPPTAGKAAVNVPAASRAPATHWADVGLLGMAAAGGLFCWRTRRSSGD